MEIRLSESQAEAEGSPFPPPPPPSFLRSQPLGREHVGRKALAHRVTDHVFRSTELGELSS